MINPANHSGSFIETKGTESLIAGTMSGKLAFSLSDSPLFKEALILTIFNNPSSVKCSLLTISSITALNNKKSSCFLLKRGYSSKWLIIISKSFKELT